MKATYHNGRVATNGHNDRQFSKENSDGHIDFDKSKDNYTWSLYKQDTFAQSEEMYYEFEFDAWLEDRKQRAIASRHPERIKTVQELLKDRQTCPEETILQIGNKDKNVSPDVLKACCLDFLAWFDKNYGIRCRTLNFALHVDEATPHLHWRKVWQYRDKDGIVKIGQEKALEQLGIELPDPTKPKGRYNNRKQTIDAIIRKKWQDVCLEHGLKINTEPDTGKKHVQKQDYILQNQKAQMQLNDFTLQLQENEIKELTDKKEKLTAEVSSLEKDLEARKGALSAIDSFLAKKIQNILTLFWSACKESLSLTVDGKDELADKTLLKGQSEAHKEIQELPPPADGFVKAAIDQKVEDVNRVNRFLRRKRK